MIFAPFECALEGAFEWCKNHQNPIKIDQNQTKKVFDVLYVARTFQLLGILEIKFLPMKDDPPMINMFIYFKYFP